MILRRMTKSIALSNVVYDLRCVEEVLSHTGDGIVKNDSGARNQIFQSPKCFDIIVLLLHND